LISPLFVKFLIVQDPEAASDRLLAEMLQAEFDIEHDREILARQKLANLNNHKV
jgi:hypothetical protein